MRITSKGQVTIPQEIREIVKASKSSRRTRGQAIVSRLRGRSTVKMSTDEILALTRK